MVRLYPIHGCGLNWICPPTGQPTAAECHAVGVVTQHPFFIAELVDFTVGYQLINMATSAASARSAAFAAPSTTVVSQVQRQTPIQRGRNVTVWRGPLPHLASSAVCLLSVCVQRGLLNAASAALRVQLLSLSRFLRNLPGGAPYYTAVNAVRALDTRAPGCSCPFSKLRLDTSVELQQERRAR